VGWRQWERWCRGRSINALPAPPEAIAAFLVELGRIVASIDTDDAKYVRDRAILLLGYASAMRPGARSSRTSCASRPGPDHHPALQDRSGYARPTGSSDRPFEARPEHKPLIGTAPGRGARRLAHCPAK
jgi:hypothetical protein